MLCYPSCAQCWAAVGCTGLQLANWYLTGSSCRVRQAFSHCCMSCLCTSSTMCAVVHPACDPCTPDRMCLASLAHFQQCAAICQLTSFSHSAAMKRRQMPEGIIMCASLHDTWSLFLKLWRAFPGKDRPSQGAAPGVGARPSHHHDQDQ